MPSNAQKMIADSYGDLLAYLSGAYGLNVSAATDDDGWAVLVIRPAPDATKLHLRALDRVLFDLQSGDAARDHADQMRVDVTNRTIAADTWRGLVGLLSLFGAEKGTMTTIPAPANDAAPSASLAPLFQNQARNALATHPHLLSQISGTALYNGADALYAHIDDILNMHPLGLCRVRYGVGDLMAALQAEDPQEPDFFETLYRPEDEDALQPALRFH